MNTRRLLIITIAVCAGMGTIASARAADSGRAGLQTPAFPRLVRVSPPGAAGPWSFRYSTALPRQAGVTRRDPSDVIKVSDTYYVWYTKVTKGRGVFQYPSGYSGDVYYATSKDAHHFTERGRAITKGGTGAWDEHGVFTPNILVWKHRYYLYYTGVPSPFNAATRTAIGVAIANSPDGPWKKFKGNPVLRPNAGEPGAFDSMRVDDAALVAREGRIFLYYKGRCILDGRRGPSLTHMGVATAREPTGPFVKSDANPLLHGHEVLVWPQGHGVASMVTSAGPREVYFAADGVHFKPEHPIIGAPAAPGIYRADGFDPDVKGGRPRWGVSMGWQGGDIYLRRFDIRPSASSR